MKTVVGLFIGFATAITLFLVNESIARHLAFYVAFAGIVIGCIVAFCLLAVALVPSAGTGILSILTAVYSHVSARKPAKQATPKVSSQIAWVAAPHVDYEQYEVPTYLRRGFDRGAL